jgi:hypothetical protein
LCSTKDESKAIKPHLVLLGKIAIGLMLLEFMDPESSAALLPHLGLKPQANSENQLKQVGEMKIKIAKMPTIKGFNPFQRV